MRTFDQLIKSANLSSTDQKNLRFLYDFLNGAVEKRLASRSFIFYGDPGVGKTFLVEKLLGLVNTPVVYAGVCHLKRSNCLKLDELTDVLAEAKKQKSAIVFLDDLEYLFKTKDMGDIEYEHSKAIMELLEFVKQNQEYLLIITSNDYFTLREAMLDRIEVKIFVDLPTEHCKKEFINKNYSGVLPKSCISFLARESIGYNYRDIPELVKLAYREGNYNITKAGIKKVMKEYKPAALMGYNLLRDTGMTFKDIIGNENAKNALTRIIQTMKNRDKAKKFGFKRNNLIMLYGPPGTGKSLMIKALAGEVGWLIVKISSLHIHTINPFANIRRIIKNANKFKNCIIFIDEAEKILARGICDEDGPIQADLQSELEGVESTDALIIFAVNTIGRFGPPMLDRFSSIEFVLPGKKEREEFFRRKMQGINNTLPLSLDNMSSATDGMSYRGMEKVWNELMYALLEEKTVDETLLHKIVRNEERMLIRPEMFG